MRMVISYTANPEFFLLFSEVVDRVYFCDAENKSSQNVPAILKF